MIKQKSYLVIIEFLKISANAKIEAAKNVMEGSEKLGFLEYAFSNKILEITNVCNRILITLCQNYSKAKEEMLKYLQLITLIPPPDSKNEKAWKEHSERSDSDIELINEIIHGNNQVANISNQKIRKYVYVCS